ncbi:MAG: hypothetical protein R6X33_02085 [Candidatus Brocadiia bacterium]
MIAFSPDNAWNLFSGWSSPAAVGLRGGAAALVTALLVRPRLPFTWRRFVAAVSLSAVAGGLAWAPLRVGWMAIALPGFLGSRIDGVSYVCFVFRAELLYTLGGCLMCVAMVIGVRLAKRAAG